MRTSQEINLIAAALVKIQSEIEPALKNAENPHFRSRFANLDSIWNVASPVLTKNNVAVFQGGDLDGASGSVATLVTRLIHVSGQWIEGRMPLLSVKANDPQALGSSITYMKRYGLAAALGITTTDDDTESSMDRSSIIQQKMNVAATQNTKLQPLTGGQNFVTQSPLSPQGAFGPDNTMSPEVVPSKIREIGGKRYADIPVAELQKHAKMVQSAYLKNGWEIKGYVAEFLDTVNDMTNGDVP